jgi:hypothetical protein
MEKIQRLDPRSGMNILDLIFENLVQFFGSKIPKFYHADPDPGSWMFSTLDPEFRMEKVGSGIRSKHPGSATLVHFNEGFQIF